MVNSTWENLKLTYYMGKILGLFPFAGRHKLISLFYSLSLWILLGVVSVYINFITLIYTKTIPPKHQLLVNVISIRVFFKIIVAVLGVVVSAQRSYVFFKLVDKFQQFDTLTLKLQPPPNLKTQSYYLLYAFITEAYYFFISYNSNDVRFIVLFMWTLNSASTMLMMIQFVVFVMIIREKYKLANHIFLSNINPSMTCTQRMSPKEIASLYNELRNLTEDVKNYYAYHAILTITDSVLLFVSNVTALTLNYTNEIDLTLIHNKMFLIYCILKLIFLILIVRETHNTVEEARKTVFIAHEALGVTTNKFVIKELEIFIIMCWNHPIIFDVFDFFDLDYKLLQSITASVVTYVVVLVQIELAISNTT